MYIDHIQTYIKKYARTWRKIWTTLFISRKVQGRITTNCSDPASSSQQEALLHLMKSLDHSTLWYCNKKPTTLPYKIQKFQPLDLWDEGSIYRLLKGVWVSFWGLISVFSLIFLDAIWRMMISYSSLGEITEGSVTGEASGGFHDFPPHTLPLSFVHSRPSHPIERIFHMHRTLCEYLGGMHRTLSMEQVGCIALCPWSRWDGPVLTGSE